MLLWMDKSKSWVDLKRFSSVLSVENSQVLFHVRDAKLQDSTTCLSTEPTLVPTACSIIQKEGVCVCVPCGVFLSPALFACRPQLVQQWHVGVVVRLGVCLPACAAKTNVINKILV